MNERPMMFLVGDNPFHGISHLSQERARARFNLESQDNAEHAARLVESSLQNGADGFMFSADEMTISILKILQRSNLNKKPELYAIVPYAYEFVRRATQEGGISSLARKFAQQMLFSPNAKALAMNVVGLIRLDPSAFLNTYIVYEIARIKSAVKERAHLKSVLLHEIITDMALGFDLDWPFKSYIEFMLNSGVQPGFETRNFAYLARKFREWEIDFSNILIAAPFNKIGFQMNPSRIECEKALDSVSGSDVIAMSILAAGYHKPSEAIQYISDLPGISGVVVGVSKERHSVETFQLLRQGLGSGTSN